MQNFYLISSDDPFDNNVKIYAKECVLFSKKEKFISNGNETHCFLNYYDEFISEIIMLGKKVVCDNLAELINYEDKSLLYWYTKSNWENVFWLIGYDVNGKKEETILNEVKKYTSKEILLYLQNAEVLLTYYNKGFYYKRFRLLYEKYEELVIKNEKNKLVIEFVKESVRQWRII